MTDQLMGMIIPSVVLVVLPVAIGLLIGWRGSGHLLWVAAIIAFLLAVFGALSLAAGRGIGVSDYGPSGLDGILFGYLCSFTALLVGLATGTAELVHALRTRQVGWIVVLVAIGLVPLLAALLTFDLNWGILANYHGGEPIVFQGELLAFDLLPIGPIALTAYGLRRKVAVWWTQRTAATAH